MDDDGLKRAVLAADLTGAFIEGAWEADLIAESGAATLGYWPAWMPALAMRVTTMHRTRPVERRDLLFKVVHEFLVEHRIVQVEIPPPPPASASPSPPRWGALEIPDPADLATRLELSDGQLAWLADVRSLERTVSGERRRNYRYRALPRDSGIPRVIEAPKARLKEVQRWILREILDHVPPHGAAHGFTRGRSAVTHAAEHAGRAAVLRLDLRDFFAAVSAGRVYGIWRTIGYSTSVSHVLTGLTTNTVPLTVWNQVARATPEGLVGARFHLGRQLATPHLPQGAPTSPALANLAAHALDRRLTGLARASGLTYSRYADDLTFSGGARLLRRSAEFEAAVVRIVRAEGFLLNASKTRTQSAGGRQTVCGVVVNAHPNLGRGEYDRLKATLHNAARHGPVDENRGSVPNFRAHLLGRISWVESLNPARGVKLRAAFDQIDWS